MTSVFSRPGSGFLLAGVGRAREILVLYPWKGKELRCRGAVLPCYEFHSPQHLTDKEWLTRLDMEPRPALPEWLRPIVTKPQE